MSAGSSTRPTPSGPQAVAMEKCRDKLWLMKVPNFLMDHLQNQQDPHIELGVLTPDDQVFASGGSSSSSGGGGSFTLRLADHCKLAEGMPRELSVTFGAPAGTMHVLSEPKDQGKGGAWRMEGQIERKGEIKSKGLTREYKSIVSKRSEQASIKREIQTWDEGSSLQQASLKESRAQREDRKHAKAAKLQKIEDKPEALSSDEIEHILFREFAKKPFMSRGDLMHTPELRGQKQANVNAVLSQLCEHVKVGLHKGDFQLKAEFRTRA